jgi:C1A family cysteine protease
MGVVSSVYAQGSCGACWAITAVETIESAYAIQTGSLLDLAEEEVIACDGTCELCNGGWPQNASECLTIQVYLIKKDLFCLTTCGF